MTLIAILAVVAVLVTWLAVRRPRWLCVVGRVLFDAMAVAGRWYALTEPAVVCRTVDTSAADLDEVELTTRLLTGALSREAYQRAMAALAAADATRHPVALPPGTDGLH
jgi:hypothetical protein